MKPNPFSGLNHFTVPVGMDETLLSTVLVLERRVSRYGEPRVPTARNIYFHRLKTAALVRRLPPAGKGEPSGLLTTKQTPRNPWPPRRSTSPRTSGSRGTA